jgi:Holliday junction DNA helicase RuvA
MIAYIQGTIIKKEEKALIILTSGIGYRIFTPLGLISESKIDDSIFLYIHTIVREDGISLYGFNTAEDLAFFTLLLSVKGVGPKMSLDILSYSRAQSISAILTGEALALTKIKGLGMKTAERIILELKNKISPSLLPDNQYLTPTSELQNDLILALESLGYEKYNIYRLLKNKPKQIEETEEVIRWFLKNV